MAFLGIVAFAALVRRGLSVQSPALPAQLFREHVSREDLCDMILVFSQPTANNLGNQGPETGERSIRYSGIFPKATTAVDLVVTAETDYTAKNSDSNGLQNGVFGQINIQSGTSVTLKYQFQDSASGAAIEVPPFIITFFDFDSSKLGRALESMTARGFTNYTVAPDTELDVATSSDGSLVVTAT